MEKENLLKRLELALSDANICDSIIAFSSTGHYVNAEDIKNNQKALLNDVIGFITELPEKEETREYVLALRIVRHLFKGTPVSSYQFDNYLDNVRQLIVDSSIPLKPAPLTEEEKVLQNQCMGWTTGLVKAGQEIKDPIQYAIEMRKRLMGEECNVDLV